MEATIRLEGAYPQSVSGISQLVNACEIYNVILFEYEDIRKLADILHVKGVYWISFSGLHFNSDIGYLFSKPIPRLSRVVINTNGFETSSIPKDVWLIVRGATVSVKGFKKLEISHFDRWAVSHMINEFTGTHLMLYYSTCDPGLDVVDGVINDAIRRCVTHLEYAAGAQLLETDRLDVFAGGPVKRYPRAWLPSIRTLGLPADERGERRHRRKIHKLLGSTPLSESIIENVSSM